MSRLLFYHETHPLSGGAFVLLPFLSNVCNFTA